MSDYGTVPLPSLDELRRDPGKVRDLEPDQAAVLLIQLAPLAESLRLRAVAQPTTTPAAIEPRWVSPGELARLRYPGRTPRWVVAEFGRLRLPWVDRRSRKTILFELGGFDRYTGRPRA
jgi:hypothetical protein